jgi:hypothetical protein
MATPESVSVTTETGYNRMWNHIHDTYEEMTSDQNRESGLVKAIILNRLLAGVAVIGTLGYVGAPAGAGLISRLHIGERVDQENSRLSAEKLHAEDVHFDLRSVSVWALEGQVGTRWTVLSKDIPGSGFGAKFASSDTTGTNTDPRSKLVMWSGSGNINSDPSGPQVVVQQQGEKQVVIFPIEALVTNLQFSEADTKVVEADRTFTQGLESDSKLGGFVSKTACNTVTLGKKQEMCSALFDFGAWANKNQAEVEQLLRYKTLEEVQKTCAPQQWAKERVLISKSFQTQAEKEGLDPENVEVVFTKNGQVTNEAPEYTKNMLDELKKKGILLEAPSGFKVQPVFSDIKCSDATSTATQSPAPGKSA